MMFPWAIASRLLPPPRLLATTLASVPLDDRTIGRWLFAAVFAVVSVCLLLISPARASAQVREDFVYGVIVDSIDPRSMAAAREAGFTHAKMITFWDRLEPRPGDFFWRKTDQNDFDNKNYDSPRGNFPQQS